MRTKHFWYTGRMDRSEQMLFNMKEDSEFEQNLTSQTKNICKRMHQLAIEDAEGNIPQCVREWPKYRVYGGLRW